VADDGTVVSAARYFDATSEGIELPLGLGSRHMAGASISRSTDAVAVVVSESSIVRVFDNGKIISEIIPELWMLRRHGLALQDGGHPAEPPALENAVRWSWQAKDPRYRDVRGEVVWDGARQEGWMVFEGLPPNDPRKGQYQLWIVDSKRFEHPVDGGVFDVRGETARVPIDAKLHVPDAEAFVVTYEQPGGVVVSDGPHLLVAAEKT